jgi:hypothetical protein
MALEYRLTTRASRPFNNFHICPILHIDYNDLPLFSYSEFLQEEGHQ